MQSDGPYMVSVRLMCFNHAPYIKQALEGIWMQDTDFPVEVVIGDDFSTDGTLDIIREYCANHQRQNLHWHILQREPGGEYQRIRLKDGRLVNFIDTINHCTGMYIALLDGDDYWTDCRKLQKQVGFMEQNPDCNICFHNAVVVDEDNNTLLPYFSDFKWNLIDRNRMEYYPEDLINSSLIQMSTVLIRKPRKIHFPSWFKNVFSGDMAFMAIMWGAGRICYLDENMSVYRKHSAGIASQIHQMDFTISQIYLFLRFYALFPSKYRRHIRVKLSHFIQKSSSLSGISVIDRARLFRIKPKEVLLIVISKTRNRLRLRTRLKKLIQGRSTGNL